MNENYGDSFKSFYRRFREEYSLTKNNKKRTREEWIQWATRQTFRNDSWYIAVFLDQKYTMDVKSLLQIHKNIPLYIDANTSFLFYLQYVRTLPIRDYSIEINVKKYDTLTALEKADIVTATNTVLNYNYDDWELLIFRLLSNKKHNLLTRLWVFFFAPQYLAFVFITVTSVIYKEFNQDSFLSIVEAYWSDYFNVVYNLRRTEKFIFSLEITGNFRQYIGRLILLKSFLEKDIKKAIRGKKLNVIDPINLENVGKYYYQCTNPHEHYFNISSYQGYCETVGEKCQLCPIDKTYSISPEIFYQSG